MLNVILAEQGKSDLRRAAGAGVAIVLALALARRARAAATTTVTGTTTTTRGTPTTVTRAVTRRLLVLCTPPSKRTQRSHASHGTRR